MLEDNVSYYFCHVTAENEGPVIYEFTNRLAAQYLKDLKDMRTRYSKLAADFVKENQGHYINEQFINNIIDDAFDLELLDNPAFKAKKDYCRPIKILSVCEGHTRIPFLTFPNGEVCYDWNSLKRILQELDPKTFYITDSLKKQYTGNEFIKLIESVENR